MVFLPASRQIVPGRPVVGAILRTRDVDQLRRVLAEAHVPIASMTWSGHSRSVFIAPAQAHGLWLEFRQQR